MDWLQIFILGLVSGLTEFMPLSAPGHQRLMMHLFGQTEMDPLCRLLLTMGSLSAVCSACSAPLRRLMVQRRIQNRGGRSRGYDNHRYDYRIVKATVIPVGVTYAVMTLLQIPMTLPWLALAFGANGVILFVIGNMRQGNKDSWRMTRLDTAFMGGFGCLSAIPGISLLGTVASAGVARGAERRNALSWALLCAVPLLLLRMVLDLILIIIGGTSLRLVGFFCSIGGAVLAYFGGLISIRFVRFAVNRSGLASFSYYAWGVALLTFILFLIT